jgi:hypothetical protein
VDAYAVAAIRTLPRLQNVQLVFFETLQLVA